MASIEWNERNAAHLVRRAGWGGTAEEIQRAVDDGLDLAVEKLLSYEAIADLDVERRLEEAQLDLTTPIGAIQWWLIRILYTARPLQERMTFFLHDHFATSLVKVGRPEAMIGQNELLRSYALGNFTDLTIEISKDPAMLIWLDNWTSHKDHPNENYARELLELFTLGHEHYTEDDVIAAARAFTGWSLSRRTREFLFRPLWHDFGQKIFLGQAGSWDGDDIVRIACSQEAHRRFLATKLFEYFAYDGPDEEVIDDLVSIYMDSGTEMRPLVEAILKSPEMYSEKALWRKVKSPLEHAVIGWRSLGVERAPWRFVAALLNLQGQVPFVPPDVDGWPVGMSWINSTTLLARMNLAAIYTGYIDLARLTDGAAIDSIDSFVDHHLRTLGPLEVSAGVRDELIRWISPDGVLPPTRDWPVKQRGLIQLILSLPEWQMN